MTNISQLIFFSSLSGLGNTSTVEHQESYSSLSMIAFGSSSSTVTIPVERGDTLHRVQIRFTGLDTSWYPITHQFLWYNNTTVASATQLIEVYPIVNGDNIELTVIRTNQTAGTVTLSAFDFDVKVRVMRSPF